MVAELPTVLGGAEGAASSAEAAAQRIRRRLMPAAGAATRAALQAAGARPMLYDLAGGYRSGDDLIHRVDELAATLAARGLAGRRIGLWYRNGLAAIEAFLAVEWIGATRVPVDPDAAAAEAVAVFDSAGCAGVLVDDEHAGAAPAGALVHEDRAPLRGSGAFLPGRGGALQSPPPLPADDGRRSALRSAHLVRQLGRHDADQRGAVSAPAATGQASTARARASSPPNS